MQKARDLIAEREIAKVVAKIGDREILILSKGEIMASLTRTLCKGGWTTTTLIHDEIVIRPSIRFDSKHSALQKLNRETELALRNYEKRKRVAAGDPRRQHLQLPTLRLMKYIF